MTSTRGAVPTFVKIQNRFRYFRQHSRDLWQSYMLVATYMPIVHVEVREDRLSPLAVNPLRGARAKSLGKIGTFGAISHLLDKVNPRRVISDSLAISEDFYTDLVLLVYKDYPQKLRGAISDGSPDQEARVLELVLRSTTRAEILAHLTEERVRGLFYGNPVDFFKKDRAKLEFGTYFKDSCTGELAQFAELVARRNIIVHNGGRIDRKYLREVAISPFALDQVAPLPPEYLQSSLALVEGLAAAAATKVLENVYKTSPQGKVQTAFLAFERARRDASRAAV